MSERKTTFEVGDLILWDPYGMRPDSVPGPVKPRLAIITCMNYEGILGIVWLDNGKDDAIYDLACRKVDED